MSSQRYSLSEELTHIVLKTPPGITQCYGWHPVPSVPPGQGPSKPTHSLDLAGSSREFSAPPGKIGAGSAIRGAGLESQGFTTAKSFNRYFLFWATVTSPSGHTYSQPNPQTGRGRGGTKSSMDFLRWSTVWDNLLPHGKIVHIFV